MIEDSVIIEKIQEFSKHGNIRFKKHALIRAVERNIKIEEISEALQSCGIIRIYKEDKPLKSYLILGFTNQKRPLHMVVALDENDKYIWVISVYEPNKSQWDETFKKRLK